ncbi:hypothetical protein [Aeromonas sp. SG16]|uniref:CIS tube protein n=1 Tax=Aeromonas sp. SG16 TaxID=2950548 RepID=UPI00210D37D8|nr:hypothetical protein [Aeromonas sp. SG16]MCQ4054441.1 hypothetical protein [Aeromonas sp. SG16]
MSMLERSLAKLTVRGYLDREMRNSVGSVMAMYNPDSLRLNYKANYSGNDFINSDVQSNTYVTSSPGHLYLELIFDARMPGNNLSVEDKLSALHELCYSVSPQTREPNFLSISWGKLLVGGAAGRDFNGRCNDYSVNYTLFERDGTPLRATVALSIMADSSMVLQQAMTNLKSPHKALVTVPDMSNLPMLATHSAALVRGAGDYLDLANSNNLDNLYASEPGQTLIVSPTGGMNE